MKIKDTFRYVPVLYKVRTSTFHLFQNVHVQYHQMECIILYHPRVKPIKGIAFCSFQLHHQQQLEEEKEVLVASSRVYTYHRKIYNNSRQRTMGKCGCGSLSSPLLRQQQQLLTILLCCPTVLFFFTAQNAVVDAQTDTLPTATDPFAATDELPFITPPTGDVDFDPNNNIPFSPTGFDDPYNSFGTTTTADDLANQPCPEGFMCSKDGQTSCDFLRDAMINADMGDIHAGVYCP